MPPRAKKKSDDAPTGHDAQRLMAAGMPEALAASVAQGRMELNDALERMAQRNEVERLMRKHDLSRALATQVVLGHADLDAYLAKRRLAAHLDDHRTRSILEEALADGEPRIFHLHGQRKVEARVTGLTPYEATLTPSKGEPEVVHKLQFKVAYPKPAWKRAGKAMKKDKALWADPKAPIRKPQDRYSCSDRRLFRYMDAATPVTVTTLEGDEIRGVITWFGRFEFGLRVKGDVELNVFRHALHQLTT